MVIGDTRRVLKAEITPATLHTATLHTVTFRAGQLLPEVNSIKVIDPAFSTAADLEPVTPILHVQRAAQPKQL